MRFYRFYEKVVKVKADVPAILNSCLLLRSPQIDADHREAVHGWGQSGDGETRSEQDKSGCFRPRKTGRFWYSAFDCFGLGSRATCFDGDLHSTFHRIFEGHLDSE